MITNHPFSRPSLLLLAASLVVAGSLSSTAAASDLASYPLLPDLPGADVRGEARILIHFQHDTPLVEVDGQLYALDGRALEIGLDDLDHVTLLFVAPPGTGMFVTEDGLWTEEIDPSATSELLAFDVFGSSVKSFVPEELGFELALPGQPAPTVPDVVIRPTRDDPDPR
jgi:hypothetical protein